MLTTSDCRVWMRGRCLTQRSKLARSAAPEEATMSAGVGKCWICSSVGKLSRDHRLKASTVRGVYGEPTQRAPLYLHNARRRNALVRSSKSDFLKSPTGICIPCNTARTSASDRAWDRLFEALQGGGLQPGNVIDPAAVFGVADAAAGMLAVHLYFLKVLGGEILSNAIPMDIGAFSAAIMSGAPHPSIRLKLGAGAMFAGEPYSGATNLGLIMDARTGKPARAIWRIMADGRGVELLYAAPGQWWDGLASSWHPNDGVQSLTMADFGRPLLFSSPLP